MASFPSYNAFKSTIQSESKVLNPTFDLAFKFILAWTIDVSEKFNLQITFVHKITAQWIDYVRMALN